MTQKTGGHSEVLKTQIIENWTDTLRKVGVDSAALKKLPNLLSPYEQHKLNLMITKQIKKFKETIDRKYERMAIPENNMLHSASALEDREIKAI